MMSRILPLLLAFFIYSPLQALATSHDWNRHVLTEDQGAGRTLLLVVDVPQDKSQLQQVIFRQSYTDIEVAELNRQKNFYLNSDPSSTIHISDQQITANLLWPVTQVWTEQAEQDFGQWVHDNASEEMLVGGGVSVDCADYAITLRWIYAHDHGLPAANALAGSGSLFGSWQSSSKWDRLATNTDWRKDERFKAALRYLLDNSYTHSIVDDLYPVAINRQSVSPGAIYLTLQGDSGHTRTIYDIGANKFCMSMKECIMNIWGNEPASERGYISDLVPFRLAKGEGGFMRFRWPEKNAKGNWSLRPGPQMPGYSLEQFSWSEDDFLINFSNGMGLWTSPKERFTLMTNNIVNMIYTRLVLTSQGYFMCSLVPCAPGSPDYDQWSTPQRDLRMKKAVEFFRRFLAKIDPASPEAVEFDKSLKATPALPGLLSFYDIVATDVMDRFSSDPRADLLARWGVASGSPRGTALALLGAFSRNWYMRDWQVTRAQQICYPNKATTPQCSSSDPRMKLLNTQRLDQGMRKFQDLFAQVYSGLSADAKFDLDFSMSYPLNLPFCPANKESMCTFRDMLISAPEHIQNMTSDPEATLASRYGF